MFVPQKSGTIAKTPYVEERYMKIIFHFSTDET